ncbi:hypothetical protein EDEG_01819 [Edhazardia aedis USNM 41457]|uniref:Uncharacterized protein n=1 Tax=Edhazardia aedis (strain USNM 41457) TaxID=1003232 RepID=J9D7W7_EDHAE|nr:hypothetical protein EDEG_01819 [Edhazardia aedis USNM 41457]|eukprot:EJW03891.1 hypothetical protein EDEG_01819 [Edhazardia aedis USNM 41457]
MAEIFMIFNTNLDIIYEKNFNFKSDKEYCTQILLSYAMSDFIPDIRKIAKNYFYSIEVQFSWNISVFVLNSGMCFMFLNECRYSNDVEKFFGKIRDEFSSLIENPFWDENDQIEDINFEKKCAECYDRYILADDSTFF